MTELKNLKDDLLKRMNNTEKRVVINLEANAAPPVKFRKAKNGRPSESNFSFFPKLFANLKDYVRCVKWDAHNKKLFTEISETPKFEVYKWMEYMSKQSHDIQKSPFVNIDMNVCTLVFADHSGIPVSTARFKNLTICHHACLVRREDYDNRQNLVHELQLQYESVDVIVHADIEETELPIDRNDHEKDREWQTIELPA